MPIQLSPKRVPNPPVLAVGDGKALPEEFKGIGGMGRAHHGFQNALGVDSLREGSGTR
jgi:hypothetical protein